MSWKNGDIDALEGRTAARPVTSAAVLQGIAIPMYALDTVPLISKLTSSVFQVWYTDAAAELVVSVCGGKKFLVWAQAMITMQML